MLKKTSYTSYNFLFFLKAVKKSLTISKHLSLISKEIIKKTAHEEKAPALLRPDSYKAAY